VSDPPNLSRPEPSTHFRAGLRDQLREEASEPAWRPRRPAGLALAYVVSGTALMALAGLGLAGVGPLA
jgi:hypothetical protein